jgi:hypothetical protein
MTNQKQDLITNKIKNIYTSLHNSEDLGISITNELNSHTDKLISINEKSKTIYQKLLNSSDVLNKMTLSLPTFNIKLPFLKKKQQIISNNNSNIDLQKKEEDEMDKISNRLNNLKNIAIDMNMELKKQNTIVDEITFNNENSLNVFSENNDKIKKLL